MSEDRRWGVAILVMAVAIGLESLSFIPSFQTDPLGPKAFPLFSALLLAAGASWTVFRPARPPAPAEAETLHDEVQTQPDEVEALSGGSEALPGAVWLAAGSFVAYALLLEPLGFFTATLAEFVALSLLFGGRALRSALTGAVFVGALYLLFVQGLGLTLPTGSLFLVGR